MSCIYRLIVYAESRTPMTELAHKPSPRTDSDPAKKKDRLIKGAALFAGTAAVAAALTGCGSSEKADSHSGTHASAIDELPIAGDQNGDGFLSKDELHGMAPDAVAKVDPKLLASAYASDFDAWRQDTLIIQMKHGNLSDETLAVIGSPESLPTGPKSEYTDQQVLNQVSLDETDASIQEDLIDGKRMMPLPINPESGGFEDSVNHLTPGNGAVLNYHRQVGESLPRPEASFNGVNLRQYAQARVIKQELLRNNRSTSETFTEYGLYGLVKNGESEEWQLVRRWSLSGTAALAVADLIKSSTTQYQ